MKKYLSIALVMFASAVNADFDKGMACYQASDFNCAMKEFKSAAEQGQADGQYGVGLLYDNGNGIEQDDVEAIKWYRLAAAQGHVTAQYNLGYMHQEGEGVAQDFVEAAKWYRLAADQGNVVAQYNLGVLYLRGDGVEKNLTEAVKLIQSSANEEYTKAQRHLGYLYENGLGVAQDYQKALELYSQAYGNAAKRQFDALTAKLACLANAKTQFLNVALVCANRNDLMAAVKKAGAVAKSEGKHLWDDIYDASKLMTGSSELVIDYTVDNLFAKARYVFPNSAGAEQLSALRDALVKDYGEPAESSGNPVAGAVSYVWHLADGIDLMLAREKSATESTLVYVFPKNYQAMLVEQERQKKAAEEGVHESLFEF